MSGHWGADLGGTKIEAVVVSTLEPLDVIARVRIPTEADKGYDHILDQISRVIEHLSKQSGLTTPEHVGIATPGTFDPISRTMKNCNTVCLNGTQLPKDLALRLDSEVIVANDANCFALAESKWGAARGAQTVFGAILGTGIGGGIVVEGKALAGAQGIAGEWGHNVLDPEGDPCYCGRSGCVETVISGPALERFYATRSGRARSMPEIVDLSREGDRAAAETVERLCLNFGRAMATVVNILDPHVIVLGGGLGNIDELYASGRKHLADHVFNDRFDTKLVRPELGDSAGVFGACLLGAGTSGGSDPSHE